MIKVRIGDIYLSAFADMSHLVENCTNRINVSIAGEALLAQSEVIASISKDHNGYADGELACLALRKAGIKDVSKIPGVELWIKYLEKFPSSTIFAIGGSRDVSDAFKLLYAKKFPNSKILYSCDGYNQLDSKIIKARIKELEPDVILIALGQPAQEALALELFGCHVATYFCLGGSFDVFTGKVKRAPNLIILLKLEWLYRAVVDPRRLRRILRLPLYYCKLKLGLTKLFIESD